MTPRAMLTGAGLLAAGLWWGMWVGEHDVVVLELDAKRWGSVNCPGRPVYREVGGSDLICTPYVPQKPRRY